MALRLAWALLAGLSGALSLSLCPPPSPGVHHVINLSNGIEALGPLREAGVRLEEVGVMRLQSSHCEAQAFERILQELDHALLLRLALGYYVCVYDVGSRASIWPDGNRWVPRAIWWGLEWVKFVLNDVWDLEPAADKVLLRGYVVDDLFRRELFRLSKTTRKRLKYYRPYLATKQLRLFGAFRQGGTVLDGNQDAYREILHFEHGLSEDTSQLPVFGSLDEKFPRKLRLTTEDTGAGAEDDVDDVRTWWWNACDVVRPQVVEGYRLFDPNLYAHVGGSRIRSKKRPS